MTIKINRDGNDVWIYNFDSKTCGHLVDTPKGVSYDGDTELLKLYNGTRRGLIDDDRLNALYKSLDGGAKPKD